MLAIHCQITDTLLTIACRSVILPRFYVAHIALVSGGFFFRTVIASWPAVNEGVESFYIVFADDK